MKTGDASTELWLEGRGDRAYVLSIESVRKDRHLFYEWHVEMWAPAAGGHEHEMKTKSKTTKETGFFEALRRAKREAERLEREAGVDR